MKSHAVILGLWIGLLNVWGAEPAKMREIGKGVFSGVQDRLEVAVTNATQWTELWQRHCAQKTPAEKAPEIDFEKETVLFVALGRKPTGGYAAEIAEVKRGAKSAEVIVRTRSPKPGGFQLQALSAPFHIVAVPKIEGEVKFTVEEGKGSTR